jgi:hypothetical protein
MHLGSLIVPPVTGLSLVQTHFQHFLKRQTHNTHNTSHNLSIYIRARMSGDIGDTGDDVEKKDHVLSPLSFSVTTPTGDNS